MRKRIARPRSTPITIPAMAPPERLEEWAVDTGTSVPVAVAPDVYVAESGVTNGIVVVGLIVAVATTRVLLVGSKGAE